MRLRIAFETFVANSTFPSSSALVNHQRFLRTPEREKLRRRPTRSTQECAPKEKMQISSPLRVRIDSGQASQQICWSNHFFVLPRTRAFPFFSQENFFAAEKIKFIFFLSILKRISSLKPAGEGGSKAHVNKL